MLQQQLKAVGVEIYLLGGPVPDFLAKWQSGDFDVAWIAGGATDAHILRNVYASTGTNLYRVDDPSSTGRSSSSLRQVRPRSGSRSSPTSRSA